MNNEQAQLIASVIASVAVRIEESNRIANKALAVNRELLEIMQKAQKAQEVKP